MVTWGNRRLDWAHTRWGEDDEGLKSSVKEKTRGRKGYKKHP